ncbi:hypothetical protein AQZ52_17795 [Novosphingobium fuchskuhlense]|uniref:DUF64370 domain-containing protein n=1 Tax=Novosphingobium fuchskuhlense TaxID=1117702 RepID=A0A124JTA0_9SPHN|nr:DUF6437 family protein [Novosphingobium fuchskuhlense]KUR69967.1 hypothetical protein AQZ52_17795 [Novosphingobium fuchskuhlense]
MARSKASARDALMKVQRQREELAAEEARLRESAAAELGKVMLDCGAEAIEPSQLRRLMVSVQKLGLDETLKRISRA